MTTMPADWRAKTVTPEELLRRHGRPRDGRLVFTNGCFDILHRGHVEYLAAARALGDLLVVGLNADASVSRLKGAGRPINSQEDRAAVLGSLAAVDVVTIFHEDTPRELIAQLLPDILVKGGDYDEHQIVGRDEVRAAGGAVVIVPLVPGRSTTGILKRATEGVTDG